jgi:hypothetical protein
MQRLEQASRNVILLLFLIKTTVDAYMPVFALIALVAYSVSLALIIPGLLQKNSGWRRMAILCGDRTDKPRLCAGITHHPRRRQRAKPERAQRRLAGQPDDLYGNDHRRV